MENEAIKILYRFLIILSIICFVLFLVLVGALYQLKDSRYIKNCSSFSSYSAALRSYQDGNKSLDRGGYKGIPCESLLNKK